MFGSSQFSTKKLAVGFGGVLLLAISFFTAGLAANAQDSTFVDPSFSDRTLTVTLDASGVEGAFVDVVCADVSALQQFELLGDRPTNVVSETGDFINVTIDDVVFRARCFVDYPAPDVANCAVLVEGLGTVEVQGEEVELFERFPDGIRVPGFPAESAPNAFLTVSFPDDGPDRDGVVTITCDPNTDDSEIESDDLVPEVAADLEPITPGPEPVDSMPELILESEEDVVISDPETPDDVGDLELVEVLAPIECLAAGGNIVQFGDEFFGVETLGNRLAADGPTEFEFPYTLEPGTYALFAQSVDAYNGREEISQPTEQWFAEFLAADGSVLVTSGTTEDVPDGVRVGQWSGSVGEITLDADVVAVRVVHATPDSPSRNSVRPVCLSATEVSTVESAEAAERIEEPEPALEPAPEPEIVEVEEVEEDEEVAVEPEPESEPAATPAPTPTPTILGVIDVAPVAQSQAGNPRFTG